MGGFTRLKDFSILIYNFVLAHGNLVSCILISNPCFYTHGMPTASVHTHVMPNCINKIIRTK